MPLLDGNTPEAIQHNIRELIAAGHPPDQAAAIAYAHARGQRHVRHDAVPSHIVSLARAHEIALKQRNERGHFSPGHSVRGRVPRASHPDALEAGYASAIVKLVVNRVRELVKPALDELPAQKRSDESDDVSSRPAPTTRRVSGFDCVIENPAGSRREWVDGDGTRGSTLMRWDYGYIAGARGADGEDVDVYIGPDASPEWVFVIHQMCKATNFTTYDEDKVMLGWPTADAARAAYAQQYDDARFFGGMSMLSLDAFAAKLLAVDGEKITHADASDGGDFSAAQRAKVRSALDRARREMQGELSTARLEAVANDSARQLSTFNAAQFSRQVKAAIGIDVTFRDKDVSDMIDAFVHQNVSLIRSLGNRALDDVEKIISNAVATGDSRAGIADDIEERHGVSERHARLIARDQIGKLNSQLTQARHDEMGVSRFRVRTRGDDKVRDSHRPLNGKVFSYDDLPIVDGEEFIPGRPICCRCEQEPVFDDIKAAIAAARSNAVPQFEGVTHSARAVSSRRRGR